MHLLVSTWVIFGHSGTIRLLGENFEAFGRSDWLRLETYETVPKNANLLNGANFMRLHPTPSPTKFTKPKLYTLRRTLSRRSFGLPCILLGNTERKVKLCELW